MPTDASRAAKLQSAYKELSKIASLLNNASDQLTQAVEFVDDALAQLNIGLPSWFVFDSYHDDDDPGYSTEERLGYAKVGGKWGIALIVANTDERNDQLTFDGPWLFSDAPRALRIKAIEYLPQLVETMTKEAARVAEQVTSSAGIALELAESLGANAKETR